LLKLSAGKGPCHKNLHAFIHWLWKLLQHVGHEKRLFPDPVSKMIVFFYLELRIDSREEKRKFLRSTFESHYTIDLNSDL
jgi:hypothetical protein